MPKRRSAPDTIWATREYILPPASGKGAAVSCASQVLISQAPAAWTKFDHPARLFPGRAAHDPNISDQPPDGRNEPLLRSDCLARMCPAHPARDNGARRGPSISGYDIDFHPKSIGCTPADTLKCTLHLKVQTLKIARLTNFFDLGATANWSPFTATDLAEIGRMRTGCFMAANDPLRTLGTGYML